jgi:hypothetical protein
MSDLLKPGTLCVIIAGCPENIGMIVEVVAHIGVYEDYKDAYEIRTVTGRTFNQLWDGDDLVEGYSENAITERWKLRPLVGDDVTDEIREAELQN